MRVLIASVAILTCAASVFAITIDTVPVGDPGNAGEIALPNFPEFGTVGGVAYEYRIGKYEVTVGQYTEFLNTVAATDTYGLYNPNMATDLRVAGISQNGVPGSYTYSVIGSPNHPVTYVSWGDAARFTNWLHNGQPTGQQDSTTTEDGAYTLNGATSSAALDAVSRNANAKWFLPTESEWYKAAYYQPAAQGGDVDNYWRYSTRTNSIPFSDQPPGATPDNTRVANIYSDDRVANGYDDGYAVTGSTVNSSTQNYLTDVGAYASSPSFYGTFDQTGNVWEWNEARFANHARGFRGSDYATMSDLNSSVNRQSQVQSGEFLSLGFRVAAIAVPEPSTLALAVVGLGTFPLRRRK